MDCNSSGGNPNTTGTHGVTLTDRAVRQWGTPAASQAFTGSGMRGGDRSGEAVLAGQAKQWPTPTSRDTKGEDQPNREGGPSLVNAALGRQSLTTPTDGTSGPPRADLNPRFVAALMGVPWDWLTPSTSVETASYLEWQRLHCVSSPSEREST